MKKLIACIFFAACLAFLLGGCNSNQNREAGELMNKANANIAAQEKRESEMDEMIEDLDYILDNDASAGEDLKQKAGELKDELEEQEAMIDQTLGYQNEAKQKDISEDYVAYVDKEIAASNSFKTVTENMQKIADVFTNTAEKTIEGELSEDEVDAVDETVDLLIEKMEEQDTEYERLRDEARDLFREKNLGD